MTQLPNRKERKRYERPTVQRVLVDPIMEMLTPCTGTTAKNNVGDPAQTGGGTCQAGNLSS